MADELDIDPSEKWSEQLFPDETTEEALARIVAQAPLKHGVTLEQRKARAAALFSRVGYVDQAELTAEDARIVEIGGDPNEMLPGNKPRYTVDEAGNVKDHETGEVHIATPQGLGSDQTGVEEVHGGEAMVEEGPGEASEGLPAVGLQQDRSPRARADGGESSALEPSGNESADDAAATDQPARLVDDAGAEAVGGAIASPVQSAGRNEPLGLSETRDVKTIGISMGQCPDGEITGGVLGSDGKVYTFAEWEEHKQHTAALQQVMDDADSAAHQATCGHQWPDDPQPETPCPLCGLTFEKWANS